MFNGPVDPSFANQIHDYDPGNAPDGVMWTVPVPAGSFEADLSRGTARLRVVDLPMPDYGSIPNALLHGKSVPATVSFEIGWNGVAQRVQERDLANSWTADKLETDATIVWSARQDGFEFVSDPAATSKAHYAVIGRERNGRYAFAARLGPGGQSTRYTFDYPGDESVYTVGLDLAPDAGEVLDRAGFKVFGPTGSLQATGGPQRTLSPNVAANVVSRNRGRHVVEVYNYHPTLPVDFRLGLARGLPEGRRR